jgi:hypothetical protein
MGHQVVASPCLCIPPCCHGSERNACFSSLWRLKKTSTLDFPKRMSNELTFNPYILQMDDGEP